MDRTMTKQDFHKCTKCEHIAATCTIKNTSLPFYGRTCPHGYTREDAILELLYKYRGIVDMYLKCPMPIDEYMQEAYVVILTARQEHDPKKGTLGTCVGKVARRRNMQLRRSAERRNRETSVVAEILEYHHERQERR